MPSKRSRKFSASSRELLSLRRGRRAPSMARRSNPIPLAHVDKKELETVLAAGLVRNGELSETAFEVAYGLRPNDAERDLILKATERATAEYVHITDGENLTDDGNS